MQERISARAGGVIAALAMLLATPAGAALDPGRVGWTAAELSGSKLLLSATATVALTGRDTADVAARLLVPPQGAPVAPGPRVMEMHYDAALAGQRTVMTLLLDPASGASLQTELVDSGRRQRERRWRFTDIGGYHWTRRPADSAEKTLAPARWTDRSEGLRPYPAPLPTMAVAEPAALVYLLAAAPLLQRGDRLDLVAFSRRRLHRVGAEVVGRSEVSVNYRERRTTQVTQQQRTVQGLRVELRGTPWNEGDEEPFQFLGLSGAIEVVLDPATRLPLQIAGTAPVVGRVTLRLRAATLE